MGIYIDKGNDSFRSFRNSEYVDKTELIAVVNATLDTERRYSCVSRCRRFGKSMAAKMLLAYYDRSCDSRHLFADLKIAADPSFEEHLNRYPVIYLDITDFTTRYGSGRIVRTMENDIMADLHGAYSDVPTIEGDDLMAYLQRINRATGQKFIFIIDEWDAICREYSDDTDAVDTFVRWLRRMFKGSDSGQVFAGVYMTGILPIKKYNTQSALNNFTEYSMIQPRKMSRCFGFTKDEVRLLAGRHGMDFDEMEKWYDGYQIGDERSMFNPNSVMQAIDAGVCGSYWASTGAYDAVAQYIQLNFEGLKDNVVKILGGGRCKVDATKFQNDMSVVRDNDDVLTVLIHLGYLGYDWTKKECYLPNREVAGELVNAIESNRWTNIVGALKASEALLQSTIAGDEDAVARGIEAAHDENTSILSYNNENSLACVLSIAYYYARNDYVVHRELPTGKGFADLVLIPRRGSSLPAIVIELKYNSSAEAAISQIKERDYTAKLLEHSDSTILVGINYDSATKHHTCKIMKSE